MHSAARQLPRRRCAAVFVIFIVAHVIIGAQLLLEQHTSLSLWTEAAILLPSTLVLALALLRPVKGATLGWMLKVGLLKQDDAA